jgi:hypothetical protein
VLWRGMARPKRFEPLTSKFVESGVGCVMPVGRMSGVGGGLNRSTQHFILEREKMECTVMDHRYHRGFTAAEKTELWDRWQRGESLA